MQTKDRFGWSGTEGRLADGVATMPALQRLQLGTKTCPRCGQILFADMDVCYGCLYDFSRGLAADAPRLPAVAGGEGGADDPGPSSGPPPRELSSGPQVNLVDDLDEPFQPKAAPMLSPQTRDTPPAPAPVVCVLVRTGEVDVTLEVPASGLRVGRAPGNDVVLHSKAVSREHALMLPADGGVIVRDLGSTNPPLFRGQPIAGSALVPFGASVLLCGAFFEPCQR